MPNYTKLEQELLTAEQRALTDISRGAALGGLDDTALATLIADLESAVASAAPVGEDGQVSARELLSAALRRANAQQRKRKQAPQAAAADTAPARPAAAAKAAKRAPASPARKPAGREKAETRKPDLRTGLRRVAKAGTKSAAAKATPAEAEAKLAAEPKPAAKAAPTPKAAAKPKPAPKAAAP
ncbi:hypothetical protein, partial [Paracoccus sp. (in: a-proteobacteria)]|uniref:hypothetical protein n=1 Tax=Paracoccus sp. TaxID=267 RepID=UPI0035B09957